MFNTLKYARMLEEVGFSKEQSEASIHILVDVMEDKLATKQDLLELRREMRQEFVDVRQEMRQGFADVRQEMHFELQKLSSGLIIKTGAMQAAAVGLIVALVKLF